VVSAHTIATLPSAPAARKVSAAVALANPPPSNRKSIECTWFRPFKITQDMSLLRIPTKPAMHSNMKPATCSDPKPAGVPI
jgi:hypothetical protein